MFSACVEVQSPSSFISSSVVPTIKSFWPLPFPLLSSFVQPSCGRDVCHFFSLSKSIWLFLIFFVCIFVSGSVVISVLSAASLKLWQTNVCFVYLFYKYIEWIKVRHEESSVSWLLLYLLQLFLSVLFEEEIYRWATLKTASVSSGFWWAALHWTCSCQRGKLSWRHGTELMLIHLIQSTFARLLYSKALYVMSATRSQAVKTMKTKDVICSSVGSWDLLIQG